VLNRGSDSAVYPYLQYYAFLVKAPLQFVQDGPGAESRVRQCGVPIQHRLSDALGEAVLFCLDFAVNKSTESNFMHDDLWFWGATNDTVTAWRTVENFARIMRLILNDGKTGSVEVDGSPCQKGYTPSKELPPGQISWGFLKMESTGKWSLDDKQDAEHIVELQRQLSACKSIFSWVQAWNIYVARFLSNNFGEPANCLGRPHNDIAFSRSRFHPTSTVIDSFMPFDEYVAYTEETSQHLRDAYTELLDPPTKEMVEFTPEIDRAE